MGITRRDILRAGAVSLTAVMLPDFLGRRVAHAAGSNPVLVAIYQRGGADGLTIVPPTFDPLRRSAFVFRGIALGDYAATALALRRAGK